MRISIAERAGGTTATSERVYLALRDEITAARMEPGRRLSENELVGEMGVSRTPIREALALLREERLVTIVPQLGTFVTRISDRAVADAAFVREALECAAVRLAADHADAPVLASLQAGLTAQEQAVLHADDDAFDRLDDRLHETLAVASGHPIAWTLSQRANGQLDRVRRLSLPEPGFLGEMLKEHRTVVAAVASGDPDAAEAAMRHHLRMVLSLLPAIRSAHPDFFEPDEAGAPA